LHVRRDLVEYALGATPSIPLSRQSLLDRCRPRHSVSGAEKRRENRGPNFYGAAPRSIPQRALLYSTAGMSIER
jgi:hypothetical protein